MIRRQAAGLVLPLIGLAFAVFLVGEQLLGRYPDQTMLYTLSLGIPVVVLGVILVWSALRASTQEPVAPAEPPMAPPARSAPRLRAWFSSPGGQAVVFLFLNAAMLMVVETLGYVITFAAFLPITARFLGIRSVPTIIGLTVGGVAFIHGVFVAWLGLSLPKGILEGLF